MKNFHLLITIALLLSGCAGQSVWVNPTKNHEEAQKDFRECKYDSQKSSYTPYGNGTSPISAGIQEGFQSVTLMNECMRSRGYYLTNRQQLEEKKAKNNQATDEFKSAIKNKDYNKALDIMNVMISQNTDNYDLYHARGNVYYAMKRYNEAITDFNKSIALGNKAPVIYVAKGNAFAELGEYDVVIELINQALSTNNDASFYNIRAYALNKKGDYVKAMEDCNRAIALDASKPNYYKNRGLAYHGKMEYEKALEQFNKSIALDPAYIYAYVGRGETYLKMGKNENASADFKKACELGDKAACNR
ncbi:MAG: tetratricopeptide repeat protein [Geobacter sp.]|nr:tetratricopeptide repeat protein [Geobacter sp.]